MTKPLTQNEIDNHIGQKLKFRRLMIGKTLDDIGKIVGVSFQQIQKYERGQNSVSCSRLFNLAQVLKVDPSYFFEELVSKTTSLNDSSASFDYKVNGNDKELINLIKSYNGIQDSTVRKKIIDLAKSLSK
jgi:transcriptional regulator with XRE-family HTH domain